ncbi:MAG: serine/threonine-protein phosphatase [Actinobacteria bacterium]|uniref:Unannotated protein n=1 Tax=freshwater metagenome TaxID=449393 RepID=A0A6J6QNF6_9ZZZZ|nr:serine/threonine-protein phosphatase [Actinomycetota bacterium]
MLRLHFSAISDVGRVRKDNQDSGYAGPWFLGVCDGVGGAARGDIASSTAVQQLRRLDERPVASDDPQDLLAQVAGALHRADDRIAELVDEDPALNGTSTTATLALFDGERIGVGHIGDSRAYLLREGRIRQITTDHTFVQSLIDEGRINEAEARVHPHRNVILKALDGRHEADPDLFLLDLAAGDRLFLCSDGASGVLDDDRLTDILTTGTPDFAAVELVRASLEAGSSDNVTCIVADVLDEEAAAARADELADLEPMLVGAAAEMRRRQPRGTRSSTLFRGHRSGDTGEIEPIQADLADLPAHAISSDPIDPEQVRYAPRAPARFLGVRAALVGVAVVGVVWMAAAVAWSWSQTQYYVGEQDGVVTIFRGVNTDLPGITLSHPYETTDVALDDLASYDAQQVRDGLSADDLDDARAIIDSLLAQQGSAG